MLLWLLMLLLLCGSNDGCCAGWCGGVAAFLTASAVLKSMACRCCC